jgi:polysaccharide export outer membrane protein
VRKIVKISMMLLVCAVLLPGCRYNSAAMKEAAREHYERGTKYYDEGDFKRADKEFKVSSNLLKRDKRINEKLNLSAPESRTEIASMKTNRDTLSHRRVVRREYVIGSEDILSIFVWQNPDLSLDVTVRPDGRISFPLIDDMEVEGLTISQLDKLLTENLKAYIKYPEVSISIRRLGGKRVIVLGEVNYPGVYQVTGTESVLEAIAMAQGFKTTSLASSLVVIKGMFTDDPRVIRASANLALKGMGSQNIILESGDIIFVPKKPISDLNWLATEVAGPLAEVLGTVSTLKTLSNMNH